MWANHWATTGIEFEVGRILDAELPAGDTVVYYQSVQPVPPRTGYTEPIHLRLIDPYEDLVPLSSITDDASYELGGRHGRAVFQAKLPVAGIYKLRCSNNAVSSDADTPAEDRIIFFRQPSTLAEMSTVQRVMQVIGGTTTVALAIVLYIIHGVTLHRRNHPTPSGERS